MKKDQAYKDRMKQRKESRGLTAEQRDRKRREAIALRKRIESGETTGRPSV